MPRNVCERYNNLLKSYKCNIQLQITRHVIATCAEKNIEFLECGGPETVKILPVELSNASENAIFTKCLNHFQLLPR